MMGNLLILRNVGNAQHPSPIIYQLVKTIIF